MASHLAGHKAGIGNAFFKLVSIFPEGFCIPLVFSVENLRTVERHGWIHPSALNSAERSALLRGGFSARRKLLRALGWILLMSTNGRNESPNLSRRPIQSRGHQPPDLQGE